MQIVSHGVGVGEGNLHEMSSLLAGKIRIVFQNVICRIFYHHAQVDLLDGGQHLTARTECQRSSGTCDT